MHEAMAKQEFDERERELVRRALRRYMRENRIGVPTLLDRIVRAHPRPPEVSIKSLQRFLADSHRTYDNYVELFHRFASALPYYEEADEIDQAAAALAQMFRVPAQAGPPESLTGEHELWLSTNDSLTREPDADEFRVPHSVITLSQVEGRDHYRVTDATGTGFADRESLRDTQAPRELYEGTLVPSGCNYLLLLRSQLTRAPKIAILQGDRGLATTAMSEEARPFVRAGWFVMRPAGGSSS